MVAHVARGKRRPGLTELLVIILRVFFSVQRRLMGKTLLDPKKDSKWERGRTRQVLHFGTHVRGGKAVGAEVRLYP